MSQTITKNDALIVYGIIGVLGILFLIFAVLWIYAEFQIIYLENVIKRKLDTKITDDLFVSIGEDGEFRALCKNYKGEMLFGYDRCESAYEKLCKIPEYQENSKC